MRVQQITRLANQYGASLVLYARQWSRDPDDALQEALVDLIRVHEPPRDPAAWLFTTVKRKAMNHARSESRRRKHTESLAEQRDTWFETEQDQTLLANEVCERLKGLPEIEREIVVARIWGELNFDQISELVGQSRSSVHRRYQSALGKLATEKIVPPGDTKIDTKSKNTSQVVP